MPKPYVGRFAPTPSGGLHLGSLLAALASYVDAKVHRGQWLLRMEDIDPPREVVGAAGQIVRTLELYGFEWDGEILYQSQQLSRYQAIVDQLFHQGICYACTCSRKVLVGYGVYPGFCQNALKLVADAAIRVRVPQLYYQFVDRVQGTYRQHLANEVGDFVVKRRDGFFAYQLAVVLDDAMQGVTDIVRGVDLLDSTPRQMYLQELLGLAPINYLHVPILLDQHGNKLSKSKGAAELSQSKATILLVKALQLLGQDPEPQLLDASPKEVLCWAIEHWQVAAIPKVKSIMVGRY